MKKGFVLGLLLGALVTILAVVLFDFSKKGGPQFLSPLGSIIEKETRPLNAYTFEGLRKRSYSATEIRLARVLKKTPTYTTWLFFFDSDGKRISGAADIPVSISSSLREDATPSSQASQEVFKRATKVIVMLHGSSEGFEYYPGFGTEHVAAVLAQNGYLTLAPDFAGYGESVPASKDDFEARFQTYTTTLNLILSIERFCQPMSCAYGLWGHSNGGQIALSVLEISGKAIPTVLWNPVSKMFPYNILYYTDTFADQGKYLRSSLAKFEQTYDVQRYSTPNFYDWIEAPIFLQQGEADEWVPKVWSDELYQTLKDKQKDISYKTYPGADHNLEPGWNQAVADLLQFYRNNLK